MKTKFIFLIAVVLAGKVLGQNNKNSKLLWREGYLDILHINNARGNSTFFIWPDGTTMLFDAGDKTFKPSDTTNFPLPLQGKLTPAQLIVANIKKLYPKNAKPSIDYAVISHFHSDHYGQLKPNSKTDASGAYKLTGITEVASLLPVKKIIDRSYPLYDYPTNLDAYYRNDSTFLNYRQFLKTEIANKKLQVEALNAGSNQQLVMLKKPKKYASFSVRNIKANQQIWSGETQSTFDFKFDPPLINEKGVFAENPLSLALKLQYGKFSYYTGGDTPGVNDWPDYDIETVLAPIIGKVEVFSMHHHGYKDATNGRFLDALSPKVVVHQSIHDPHFQQNVLDRLAARPFDVFTYHIHPYVHEKFRHQVAKSYKSTQGSVLIRVLPGGHSYYVYTIDDNEIEGKILATFGPYKCN